jgi:hypothetical protein
VREEDEQRNDDQAAADAEECGEHPGQEADDDQAHESYRMDVTCRAVLVGLLAFVAMLVPGPAVSDRATVSSGFYVVRADPRLCPSPLCGGYWVALANRGRTRCSDGARRPRCYVARAVDEAGTPLEAGVPDGALSRAEIEPWEFQGFGELGQLVVTDARLPAGQTRSGVFYRVRDLGVRCIRAPCFSMLAERVNGSSRVTVSELGLGLVRLTDEQRRRAEAALMSANGLFLAGRVERARDDGRRLLAWRVYLRAPRPRA